MSGPFGLSLEEAMARLAPGQDYAVLLERDDTGTIGLYMPSGFDGQQPHARDELYIVAAGRGVLACGEQRIDFAPGDLLHVPAHVPHRFERFDVGFAAWVIFYGPVRPPPESA